MSAADPRAALQATMAALQAQQAVLGDAVVAQALAPLLARLAELDAAAAAAAVAAPAAASEATPAQSLRQVSVLFLDVVGSTQLSQQLDPEDVLEVMDGAMQRFTAIVGAHHGKVLQYAGDSVLAVFGAEATREDDAERAVRCGLALLAEGHAQGLQVHERHGHDGFNVRTGVHTGPVVLGGGIDDEGTIRGFTVNIAARMEQTAPPGGLRISLDTWRLVRGRFDVMPQPPLEVKGHPGPMETFLVRAARADVAFTHGLARGVDGIATPLVGRDAELAQLLALCERVRQQRCLQALSVIGDAGLGKSRLRQELLRALAARGSAPRVLAAGVGPQGRGQPCGLLRDLFSRWLQVADSDGAEQARAKLEAGLSPLFETHAQMHVHLLGQLIGMDFSDSPHLQRVEPRQLRERGFRAALLALRGLAHQRDDLLLVLLEDLHWADDDSLDFVRHLLEQGAPLALVMLARPTLLEHHADWDGGRSERLTLTPLDAAARATLAAALLQRLPQVPESLRELVAARADGNPYYMEELVQMLLDDGVIVRRSGHWQLRPEGLGRARVPGTLTGVLQARLDALAAPERHALQQASIVGPQFWDATLAAIDHNAMAALQPLQHKALVQAHQPSAFADAAEYRFQHHLLHQVTYDTVLKPVRRQGHARVAAWLAARAGDRAGEQSAATAEHYRRAGDQAQAAQHFIAAAEYAAARLSSRLALDYAAQAAELLTDDDIAGRWRVALVQENVHSVQGTRAPQLEALDTLDRLAARGGDIGRRTQALLRRGLLEHATGAHDQALHRAERAAVLAAEAGDLPGAAMAHMLWSATAWNLNQFGPARERAWDGIALARRCGDANAESRLFNTLGLVAFRQGGFDTAQGHFEEALAIARRHQLKAQELMPLSNIGSCRLEICDFEGAQPWLEEARSTAAALGMRPNEMLALANLAQVSYCLGRLDEAQQRAHEAIAGLEAVQARTFLAAALSNLGYVEIARQQPAAAMHAFERAVEQHRSLQQPVQALEAVAGMGRAALALGDAPRALQLLQPVLDHLDAAGGLDGTMEPALIRWVAHQALQAGGDPRADAYLVAAHAELQAQVAGLADEAARRRYFASDTYRGEIASAWAARQAGAPAPVVS